eukprot:TRINITY_DN4913_c0_g1_i1.p1 TRINITY_DN4913_c0_g1~~TRINITY_DN4913_c0_g1_i1.p1  ORF type:complete len:93 (+),score=21.57 TRINITY_DN4913_c0_g1_i1:246-524(+)
MAKDTILGALLLKDGEINLERNQPRHAALPGGRVHEIEGADITKIAEATSVGKNTEEEGEVLVGAIVEVDHVQEVEAGLDEGDERRSSMQRQ